MRKQFAVLALGCLTLGFVAARGSAQARKQRGQVRRAKATCTLADGKTITVDYSSPRGERAEITVVLVPYGEVVAHGARMKPLLS